ncbi:MAG: class I SAM-dependent methyltransferase [Sandaracinaceae bacterium]|nr:class I SAM-dependent methyltransferase [Sandaracinaceae bacterium]
MPHPKSFTLVAGVLLAACGGGEESNDHAAHHPGATGGGEHAGHHDFSDVERFAALFDAPDRDEWQRPAEVVGLLELSEGQVVADLGAGTGYFEPHLAAAVGESGQVLALDVEEAMVAHMRNRFEEAGLHNVEARAVSPDDPGLEPGSVDRILIVDTWHHIEDRPAYARHLAAALRPGGFILVVDFTEESPHGPPESMRLSPHQVSTELTHGGLSASTVEETLPHQFVIRAAHP